MEEHGSPCIVVRGVFLTRDRRETVTIKELRLRPRLRASWRYWVIAWLVPGLVTILGAALFFVVFPSHFDPSLGVITTMLAQATTATGQAVPFSPWVLVAIQAGAGILLGPFVNSVVTFGEEWGWRGYLLPKLLPLGERKALLVSGVIWGVWHCCGSQSLPARSSGG